jgi:hypothetical protein
MPAIELPLLPSLLAACLVLVAGGFLAQRVPFLGRYSIPAPIIGGLIFAVLALVANQVSGLAVTFDTSAKTPFLLLFFASIGLTADLVLLRQGGVRLLRFLVALFPFLLVQNGLGLTIARLLGLHPVLGLVAGSITLVEGHGTGAAYAERFAEEHDILGVMGLTMTSATIGLVIGGIIGGPVAERLIRRIPRGAAPSKVGDGGVIGGLVTTPVTTSSFVLSLGCRSGCRHRRPGFGGRIERCGHRTRIPVVPVGWSRRPQRRRRCRFAAARCGLGAYRRRLPLIVLDLDNDDLGPQRGSPSGRAATDHSRRPGRAGRRLGYLGDVSVGRARL